MSNFVVQIRKISEVYKHTNADALDLCKVQDMDFQFVCKKDSLKIGDPVVHFPLDSLIPDNVLEKIGLLGKLSGGQKNRVKTVKLRGEISQGLVVPIEDLKDILGDNIEVDTDVTELLGVTKYEPQEYFILTSSGNILKRYPENMKPLPSYLHKYDIEGADSYKRITDILMEEEVIITEKMEGSNFSISYDAIEDQLYVNTRKHTVLNRTEKDENTPHPFWELAKDKGYIDLLMKLYDCLDIKQNITLWGEILGPGIQGNIYKLTKPEVRFFDIFRDGGKFVDAEEKFDLINGYHTDIITVPVLSWKIKLGEWLGGKGVKEASNGLSVFNPAIMREGIVINPMKERHINHFGRLILKQRSPEYLLKYDT